MIERLRTAAIAASGLIILLGLGFWFYIGQDDAALFQTGSLMPTDFINLDYHAGLEEPAFLLCADELCPQSLPDGPMPHFDKTERELRQKIAQMIDANPSARLMHFDPHTSQFDISERLPGDRFPVVLSLRLKAADLDQTAIAFYSYRPVGKSTKQDHSEQVARWLKMLENF